MTSQLVCVSAMFLGAILADPFQEASSGSDVRWIRSGVVAMEFLDHSPTGGHIPWWFPSVFGLRVVLPFNEIHLSVPSEYLFDFVRVVFFNLVFEVRLEWCVRVCWFQQGDVEYRVYFGIRW